MTERRGRLLGFGSALLAASLFAINGPLSGLASDRDLSAFGVVIWRGLFAASFLGAILALGVRRGRASHLGAMDRRDVTLLLAAGTAGALLNLCMFTAFERTTVALALIAFYTYPVMVAAAGTIFHGERVTRARVTALALAIGGMALVVLSQLDAAEGVRVDLVGIVLALLAAVCQVAYFTVGRSGFRHVPSNEATLVVFLISLPIYAGVASLAGGLGAAVSAPLADPALLGLTLVIGVLGAATPSVFVLMAIRRIGGTRTGILLMLEPVGGVVLAALLLGQALLPIQVVGGALVIAGGVLLQVVPERDGGEVIVTEDEPAPTF
ncbi:MAG: DMT family transporter [Chloroflexi bacterium]|nr:DMT family transporter [Chloroflexota bacterium]